MSANPWIPQPYLIIFRPCHYEALIRVPMTGFNIRAVPLETDFFRTSQEIKYSRSSVIRARHEFHIWARWEWQIPDTRFIVSLEFILLADFWIWIDDESFFVSWYYILLLLTAPTKCLNSVLVNRCCFLIFKCWCVPNYQFATTAPCDNTFPPLPPLNCK